jgi:hypothetical protein
MIALRNPSQAATSDVYEDLKPMIRRIARTFARRYDQDEEECFAEANLHFMEAYLTFDPERSRDLRKRVRPIIWNRLLSRVRLDEQRPGCRTVLSTMPDRKKPSPIARRRIMSISSPSRNPQPFDTKCILKPDSPGSSCPKWLPIPNRTTLNSATLSSLWPTMPERWSGSCSRGRSAKRQVSSSVTLSAISGSPSVGTMSEWSWLLPTSVRHSNPEGFQSAFFQTG